MLALPGCRVSPSGPFSETGQLNPCKRCTKASRRRRSSSRFSSASLVSQQFRSRTHTYTERHGQCAGAKPILLTAAVNQRFDLVLQYARDEDDPDSFRAVHLVAGQAQKVRIRCKRVYRHGERGLRRIAMKNGSVAAHVTGYLPDILNRPDSRCLLP